MLLVLRFTRLEFSVDRLIACSCSLVPSPRAIGRLACGPHGARPNGIPGTEPPSDLSARLWPSWSMPRYRRFYPIFERIDRRMVTCKKITLYRAGAGRTIPASDRRPIGFAGDPRGVYLRYPSRSFNMAIKANFRPRGANQSQAGLGNRAP